MAVLSSPSLTQIRDEFGTYSLPSVHSLSTFLQQTYPDGDRQSDFDGKGKAVSTSNYSTSEGTTSAYVTGSLLANGLETTFFFEYSSSPTMISPSSTTPTITYTDGNFSEIITGLNENTTYYYRLVAYNGFNNDSADHSVGDLEAFTTQEDATSESKPYDLQISGYYGDWAIATWKVDYSDLGLQIEWYISQNLDTGEGDITQTSEYLDSGTTSDTEEFKTGDIVQFRMRYTTTGGLSNVSTAWTDYSNSILI